MIPSAGTPIGTKDLLHAVAAAGDFEAEINRMLGTGYALAVNSGTTAFYIILCALRKLSGKREVLIPAYTAPSLTLPITKAGLKYRLVDISLDSFNMDLEKTVESVSGDTLAVLCVNMFGLPSDIDGLKSGLKTHGSNPFVLEDAASSFGTRKNGKFSGTFGDIGFLSFNRGKNLSTVSGGLIVTDNEGVIQAIREEVDKLPQPGFAAKMKIYLSAPGLALAVRPWFYTIFRQLVSGLKHTTLHESFGSFHYTRLQSSLGCSLIENAERIFIAREENGRLLYNALEHAPGIRLPVMSDGWRVVFNQFPILVEDPRKRMDVVRSIVRAGVEATILYDRPIHKIYGGNSGCEYPNAEYMADRLVLIPVHPYMTEKSLQRCIEAVKGAAG